jgi:tetratricopeptide (TPR) repeat protein
MKKRVLTLTRYFFMVSILLADLIMPFVAEGANVARDLKTNREGDLRRVILFLQDKPRYSLTPLEGRGVSLTLYDTTGDPPLRERAEKSGAPVAMDGEGKSSDLTFHIRLERTLREVHSSWVPREKALVLEMSPVEEEGPKAPGPGTGPLKDIRFGIREGMTRVVMDLDKRPAWEMARGEGNHMTLLLGAGAGTIKTRRYGPFKRIETLDIQNRDHRLEIHIRLETPLDHFRVFWLNEGNKLVMDLLDEPLEIPPGVHPSPPPEEIRKVEVNLPVQGERDDQGKVKGPALEKTEDGGRADASPEREEGPLPETGFRVRKRIPERKSTGSDPEKEAPSPEGLIHPVHVEIENNIEGILSDRFLERGWLQGSSPEEAFLFGRIQEAWENKDYEKGASLAEQFLNQFPASSLNEKISFLKGDFLSALLRWGKRDLLPKVISAYQQAISLHGQSGEVPKAYVKMAQANASAGKNYEAIGYLTVAATQYPEEGHLPLTYLTRGKVYLKTNQPQKAIQDFKTILERFPRSSLFEETRFWIANYYHGVGLYEDADGILKEIGKANPEFHLGYPEYLSLRAKNSFYRKDYDMARDYYFKALNIGHQPETVDLLLSHIGDTYHHQSREREAEGFYRAAVDHYPDSEGASIAQLRLAEYSSGVSMFKEIHEKNLDRPIGNLALLKLATRFYEKGKYLMAIETLQKVLEKPVHAEIQNEAKQLLRMAAEKEIGRLYREEDHANVILFYRSAKAGTPKDMDPEVLHKVAQSFYEMQQYGEAISLFSEIKLYDLNPASKGEHVLTLAECYLRSGDSTRAERFLEKSRNEKLIPGDQQRITILLADLYRKRGDLKKAYELYGSLVGAERALPDIDIARAYLSMGEIASAERQYEKSREALNRCIALAEKEKKDESLLQSAFMEIGNTYYLEGKHRQAIRAYEQGLDRGYGPENTGYWETSFRLALSYFETGENAEAKRIFREISEEGDPILQQKVQIKLGLIDLEDQLKRLPIGQGGGQGRI